VRAVQNGYIRLAKSMIKNICDCVFVAVRWFIDDASAFMDDVIDEMGFRFVHEKSAK
jgi:hypothetical protein